MSKIINYKLAKRLGVSSKEMIEKLAEFNVKVENHMSTLDDNIVELIMSYYSENPDNEVNEIANLNLLNSSRLKGFEIINLFGKVSYSFSFNDVVSILVAENSSGKTTILNIFICVLNGDLDKLRKIPFEAVIIHSVNESITILKDEIAHQKTENALKKIIN